MSFWLLLKRPNCKIKKRELCVPLTAATAASAKVPTPLLNAAVSMEMDVRAAQKGEGQEKRGF